LKHVVHYTKKFVSGPFVGQTYDDTCSFKRGVDAKEFAEALREVRVIEPCAGDSAYTTFNIRVARE